MNIAILASGNGSNFEAIVREQKKGSIKADIKILITDKKNAFVRQRAKRNRIKDLFVSPQEFKTRLEFDRFIMGVLKEEKIDLIVLAGFMRILTPEFVRKFKNKIINIHPALLPAFKGENAIKKAFRHGCKVVGVTVHFVDEKVDNGPILLQEAISVDDNTTLPDLEKEIHKIEHKLYPEAVRLIVDKKIRHCGKKIKIFK